MSRQPTSLDIHILLDNEEPDLVSTVKQERKKIGQPTTLYEYKTSKYRGAGSCLDCKAGEEEDRATDNFYMNIKLLDNEEENLE